MYSLHGDSPGGVSVIVGTCGMGGGGGSSLFVGNVTRRIGLRVLSTTLVYPSLCTLIHCTTCIFYS